MTIYSLTYREGFFGRSFDSLSSMSAMIESDGFNNTLAPYDICNNSNTDTGNLLTSAQSSNWQNIYLADALERLQKDVVGINLTISDLATMQQLCSYEVS